jgi:hypothetical protein
MPEQTVDVTKPEAKFYVELPGDSYGNTHYGFRVIKGRYFLEKSMFSDRMLEFIEIIEPSCMKESWSSVSATMFVECEGPTRDLMPAEHRLLTDGRGGVEVTK